MNDISKIIADKILNNPLDEQDEMVLQEWIEAREENKETFEKAQKGELAKIILKKDSEQLGVRISQKVLTKIRNEKRKSRNIAITAISSAAALIAVSLLIFTNETSEIIKIDEIISAVAPKTINNEIVLITASGNSINIEQGEALDSIIRYSKVEKLTQATSIVANNTIIIPLQKTFDMILPDGTKVWLNSGSKLVFPAQFSDTLRSVELVGEAFFEVVKNKNAPFIVKTKTLNTKVLGTKFMVTSYENTTNSEVALVEGRVNVSSTTTNHNSNLKAGEGLSFDSKHNNYTVIDININNIMNRKSDKFIFNDIILSEITTTLSRWYGVEFEFSNENISNEVFYLKAMKYDDINEIMLLLKDTKKIDYTIENNKIKIKSLMPMQ